MAEHFIILNGKRCGNLELRQAVQLLRSEGARFEVRVTWEAGDAQRYLQEALGAGVETIIAAGGDGTINEVVNCLMNLPYQQRPSLGIIPLGTANDFAVSADIPANPELALRLILNSRPSPIDIIQVNQQHYCINMATGGFGTRITTETPAKLKTALGSISYFIHALMRVDHLQAESCQIKSERFSWQGDALVIALGNGRQAGGGQQLCPEALIDDGLLHLSVITSKQWFPTLLHSLIKQDQNPNVVTHRCERLTISSQQEMIFNLDGEPLSGQRFTFITQSAALRCHLPPQCPLLS